VVRVVIVVASLMALVIGSAEAGAAPAPLRPGLAGNGPADATFRCREAWAPIQAKVSGFVIGNCRGGVTVRGVATDQCALGCVRGGKSEGRGWEAVSLPPGAHFAACGWVNLKNRLVPGSSAGQDSATDGARSETGARAGDGGATPANRCGRMPGPDMPYLERYVKRFSGKRVAGAIAPRTTKDAGLYLWAGRFSSGANKGQEGGAIAYRPRLGSGNTCVAYANVNPWRPGQRVRRGERMWTVHDRSRHLQIRYIARFQALDEHGVTQWWVNAHSTDPGDRGQPWGFVSAACIFAGAAGRAGRDQAPSTSRRAGSAATAPAAGRTARRAQIAAAAVARERARSGADERRVARGRLPEKCGFFPVYLHTITERHGLSCDQAKAVLRRLRGDHQLAPIACDASRNVSGWTLRNVARDPSLGVTRYSRGGRSFDFGRHQFPSNIWCPWPPR
jgi:hypothetical protein